MSANVVNQTAFLRTSREYPVEINELSFEVNKTYVDIAIAVNTRIIGIFPTNRPAITGESWFFTTAKQQSFRQLYPFGPIAAGASITIPYVTQGFNRMTRLFGACKTDVPDERPIPFASVTANSNIEVLLDTVNFNIVISNGAAAPDILSGQIILEWISQP